MMWIKQLDCKQITIMKRNIFYSVAIAALTLILSNQVNAQVAINTTGDGPHGSAMLDITSSSKGVLVPRMTTALRTAIDSPAEGLLVYQTDAPSGFYFYNGAAWVQLTGGGGAETDPIVKAINGIVKSDGTTISAATAGDFPILNQNTTGFASTISGILDISNGGTGDPDGNNLLPDQALNSGKFLQTDGITPTWISVTPGAGISSILSDGAPIGIDNTNPAIPKIGLTGVVPASKGGTGYNSFTVGDLLYANSTTELSKLPATEIGNALISQGIGAAPTWGKIDLAKSTNGTLFRNIVVKTSDYTITLNDNVVICTATLVITLPTAIGNAGRVYLLKTNGASITINAISGEKIETGSSYPLGQNKICEIISDGSNWLIIRKN